MAIVFTMIAVAFLAILADSIIRYVRTTRTPPVKLSAEDLEACARIVDAGLGRPWVCRRALSEAECECMPCKMLEKELRKELIETGRK